MSFTGDSCFELKPLDVICHIAAVIELIGFMQKDMIKLRMFEVIAMCTMATYMWFKTDGFVLDCKLMWSVVHLLINAGHLAAFAYEYLSLHLSNEEQSLFEGLFNIFTRAEMRAIQRYYDLVSLKKGHVVAEVNKKLEKLLLILKGTVVIEDENGVRLTKFSVEPESPQFIGEVSFYTQAQATATVRIESDELLAIQWEMDELREMSSMIGNSVTIKAHRQLPALLARQIAIRTKKLNERAIKQRKNLKKINKKLAKEKARRQSQTNELVRLRRDSMSRDESVVQDGIIKGGRRESFKQFVAPIEQVRQHEDKKKEGFRKKSRRGSFGAMLASVITGGGKTSPKNSGKVVPAKAPRRSSFGILSPSEALASIIPMQSFDELEQKNFATRSLSTMSIPENQEGIMENSKSKNERMKQRLSKRQSWVGSQSGNVLKMKQPKKQRMSKRGSWVGQVNVDEFEIAQINKKRLSKRGSFVGATEIKTDDVSSVINNQQQKRLSKRGSQVIGSDHVDDATKREDLIRTQQQHQQQRKQSRRGSFGQMKDGGEFKIDAEDLAKVRNSRLLLKSTSDMKEDVELEKEEELKLKRKPLKRNNSLYEVIQKETRDVEDLLEQKKKELKALRRKSSMYKKKRQSTTKREMGAFGDSSDDEDPFPSSQNENSTSDSSVSEIDSSDEDDNQKCNRKHRQRRGMRQRAKTLRDITTTGQSEEEKSQQSSIQHRKYMMESQKQQQQSLPEMKYSHASINSDGGSSLTSLSPRDTTYSSQSEQRNRGSFCV